MAFDKVIILCNMNFSINEFYKFLYCKKIIDDYVILCLHVDDILIFRSILEAVIKIKDDSLRNFDMNDLGEADTNL